MTQSNETANSQPERKSFQLNKRAIAIASLALTLFASTGASLEANRVKNIPAGSVVKAESPIDQSSSINSSLGMFDTIPTNDLEFKLPGGEVTYRLPGSEKSAESTTSVESKIQLSDWARLLEQDPQNIDPLGIESLKNASDQVKKLQSEGWTINQISIQGFVSDESDKHLGDNPGFGIADEKNVELANKRAEAIKSLYTKQLEQTLDATDAKNIEAKIVVKEGVEVRVDEQRYLDIVNMADSLGMYTDELVMKFNTDPGSLPANAQKLLNSLRQDRFVRIEVSATKEVGTNHNNKKDVKLVIIPILIPVFRRKKIAT